jgi:hypothetical protein
MFELPTWLRHAKLIRLYSFMAAVHYNIAFFVLFLKERSMWRRPFDEVEPYDVFTFLFLGYNIVLHGPIFIVNAVIILSELKLEAFQMANDLFDDEYEDNYALGLVHVYMFYREVFYVLNPLNWLDAIYYIIYGW